MNTAFSGLFASMAIAILLVYIVMVLVFNSLIDPFVILFSLPLATIGAFPALFLTGRALGVSALIGFLMLIGIVVTNAIVLLDLVEQHRRRGLPTYEALIEGGRTRVRPILMTAIATILALIPLAPRPLRGRDHRLRAGHGGHRRALLLDLPDPHRGSRCVLARRGRQGPRRASPGALARGSHRARIGPGGGRLGSLTDPDPEPEDPFRRADPPRRRCALSSGKATRASHDEASGTDEKLRGQRGEVSYPYSCLAGKRVRGPLNMTMRPPRHTHVGERPVPARTTRWPLKPFGLGHVPNGRDPKLMSLSAVGKLGILDFLSSTCWRSG